MFDEIARCGHSGVIAALTNGPAIALSAVLRFGSKELQQRVAPSILLGEKFISLAISEPNAGSDVARLSTFAERHGQYFVVTGNKKWITNGTYADFFVTAVRTSRDASGYHGMSLLLIDRKTSGFSIRYLLPLS